MKYTSDTISPCKPTYTFSFSFTVQFRALFVTYVPCFGVDLVNELVLFFDDIDGVLGPVGASSAAVDVDRATGENGLRRLVAELQLDVTKGTVLQHNTND